MPALARNCGICCACCLAAEALVVPTMIADVVGRRREGQGSEGLTEGAEHKTNIRKVRRCPGASGASGTCG